MDGKTAQGGVKRIRAVRPLMWLSRQQYEALVKRSDDRDLAELRKAVERCESSVRALRTWLQRNLDALTLDDDDTPTTTGDGAGNVEAVPGGWRLP
jgi:hypothetical protein